MARKQNQKALYEAIRQGQAKIAEGLKTGQMRSDRKRFAKSGLQSTPYVPPAAQKNESTDYDAYSRSFMSPKKALIILAVIAQGLVLVLGIWLGAMYFKDKQKVAEASPASSLDQRNEPAEKKVSPPVAKAIVKPQTPQVENKPVQSPAPTEKKPETLVAVTLDPSTGDNVIVIQGIEQDRQDQLLPLKDFFAKKGIDTEVFVRDGRALLVTKKGFDLNPESKGTPGYELMLQVKTAGLLYPKETGDTKFGYKPFQDCYGLLR